MFDTTHEPDMTQHENKRVRVDPKPVSDKNRSTRFDTVNKWVGLGLSQMVLYPYLDTTRTRLIRLAKINYHITCEPNMTQHENKWVRVDPKRVSGQNRSTCFDMINKWVRLGLSQIVLYPYLNTTQT